MSITMRKCQLAQLTGKTCDHGYSFLIQCERDGVIRCLRDCMPGCAHYQPVEEPVVPKGTVPKPVPYHSVGANSARTTYKGRCGGTPGR